MNLSNYPPGALCDPNAPWNQDYDNSEEIFEPTCPECGVEVLTEGHCLECIAGIAEMEAL